MHEQCKRVAPRGLWIAMETVTKQIITAVLASLSLIACAEVEAPDDRPTFSHDNVPLVCYEPGLPTIDVDTWNTAVSDWIVSVQAQAFRVEAERDDEGCAIVVRGKHVPHDKCTAHVHLGHIWNVVADGYCFIADSERDQLLKAMDEGVVTDEAWDLETYQPTR
jgi:hypothetical protein